MLCHDHQAGQGLWKSFCSPCSSPWPLQSPRSPSVFWRPNLSVYVVLVKDVVSMGFPHHSSVPFCGVGLGCTVTLCQVLKGMCPLWVPWSSVFLVGRRERSCSEQWCHILAPVMEKVPPWAAKTALSCSHGPLRDPCLGDTVFGMSISHIGHIPISHIGHIHAHPCQAEHTRVLSPGTCVLLGHSTPKVTRSCSTSPHKDLV